MDFSFFDSIKGATNIRVRMHVNDYKHPNICGVQLPVAGLKL